MKLNLNFNGSTLLRDWWKQIKTLFEEIEEAVNSEADTRRGADDALGKRIDEEASRRADTDAALLNNINEEKAARNTDFNNAYAKAEEGVEAAAAAAAGLAEEEGKRERGDSALSSRLASIEGSAHSHPNKTALDGITADDIEKWNGIKTQVSKTELDAAILTEREERIAGVSGVIAAAAEHTAYAEDILRGIINEINRIYSAIGAVVFEGGLFGMEPNDAALDGGAFEDARADIFDCGGFEAALTGVTDGGSY